jgi:hypothetical protein
LPDLERAECAAILGDSERVTPGLDLFDRVDQRAGVHYLGEECGHKEKEFHAGKTYSAIASL